MQAPRNIQKPSKNTHPSQPTLKSTLHCRSLVDLSPDASAQKQNRHGDQHHHYSSVISHPDSNSNISFNECYQYKQHNNCQSNTNSNMRKNINGHNKENVIKLHELNPHTTNVRVYQQQRQPLSQSKDVSNIAKIIMGATNHKNKNVNNTKAVLSTKSSAKNMNSIVNVTRKNQILANILNPRHKLEARTSSQTSLRDNSVTSTHSKLSHLKQSSYPAVVLKQQLIKQKSDKSLNKQNGTGTTPSHINNNHNNSNNQSSSSISATPTAAGNNMINPDYSLLLKLKQYIQQLKQNESKYVQQIDQMTTQNQKLQQELTLCKDKIAVYQIREKQMSRKIRQQQQQITNNNTKNNDNTDNDNCQQHMLIIQSLKNVINEQMSKIIQMETYKIQLQQQQKHKHVNQQHINHIENTDNTNINNRKISQTSQQMKFSVTDHNNNNNNRKSKFQQVYSFKKRNNNKLDESSIYIQDEIMDSQNTGQQQPPVQHHSRQHPHNNNNNSSSRTRTKRENSSQQSIPQPYNQLIKCLKSDSRIQPQVQTSQDQRVQSISVQEQEEQQDGGAQQDQILHQVGKYLHNIRQNVRKC